MCFKSAAAAAAAADWPEIRIAANSQAGVVFPVTILRREDRAMIDAY